MRLWVNWNRHGLATVAQVEVRAVGMHALVSHTMDSLGTGVASGEVSFAMDRISADELVLLHLDERVLGMLF